MRAGRRSTVSAIVLALAVAGVAFLAAPATAAPAWGPQRTVDTWAWSSGSSFARAADGDLVALEATDFSQGAFATDHGPYMGVFARTSSDRGATWSAPVRVSQGGKQADRAALAVSGGSTYAAWVTQQSYDNYDPSAPRVLYFRANTGGGWGKTVALTKKKGRVDSPSIAASGKRVYVAWVDANTGQVRVARSRDGGKTFARIVIGKTTAVSPDGDGMRGSASVGAAGNAVAVAWVSSGSGAEKARVSTNGGKKWHDAISVVGSLGRGERWNAVAPRLGRQARARLDDARRRLRADLVEVVGSRPDDRVVRPERAVQGWVRRRDRPVAGREHRRGLERVPDVGVRPALGPDPHRRPVERFHRRRRLVRALAGAGLRPCRPGDQRVADGRLAGRRHPDRGLHGPQRRLDQLRDVPSRRLVTHEERAERP